MTRVMWDTATPAAIPLGGGPFDATAGYIPGSRYPSSAEIRRRVPHKPHLTISTTSSADAMCLDCEPRYAQPAEAPAWVDRQHARGVQWPVVYCMASWTHQVRRALGGRQYLLWSAHYRIGPHICGACGYPAADATQWADKGPSGENVDQSLLSDRFYAALWTVNPPPPPPPQPQPEDEVTMFLASTTANDDSSPDRIGGKVCLVTPGRVLWLTPDEFALWVRTLPESMTKFRGSPYLWIQLQIMADNMVGGRPSQSVRGAPEGFPEGERGATVDDIEDIKRSLS